MTDIISSNPYQLGSEEKAAFFTERINQLTSFHMENCKEYNHIITNLRLKTQAFTIKQVPYLPVQLFKMMKLSSLLDEDIIKVLTSSGTTGQEVSKIYLGKETATLQSKALIAIGKSFIGDKRLPMIIIDTKNVFKDRSSYSARGAGILGFSNFGRDHFYALDENMEVDWEGLNSFAKKYKGEKILLFGFTFMIWQYFYKKLINKKYKLDFSDGILIHGGGWKKLQDEKVDNIEFNRLVIEQLGVKFVHNYYGMVEQVGSIYMECESGYFHTPDFADIIIRDTVSYKSLNKSETGLIQVMSLLPKSYPGHSILTEDLGYLVGEDDCLCGRKGKYFKVIGRLPKAEIRGCSDTHSHSN